MGFSSEGVGGFWKRRVISRKALGVAEFFHTAVEVLMVFCGNWLEVIIFGPQMIMI